MGPYGGFLGINFFIGAKEFNKPFFNKGFPVLYFAVEML